MTPGRGTGSPEDRVLALTGTVRETVLPLLGAHAGRAHEEARAAGGDVTFAIDARAEEALAEWIADFWPDVAFFSEDRGLVEPDGRSASHVLLVDPVDGTRPALAGFEAACVAVALAPLGDDGEPTLGDVEIGCVQEIKTGARFLARRGGGVTVADAAVGVSGNEALDRMFFAYGFRGRPSRAVVEVVGDLIDACSAGGGAFETGSQCFGMTRIATGQLDAVVEVGARMVADVPGLEAEFRAVGGGELLNNAPYDIAAPKVILEELGGVVTDGYGRPLDDKPLLGSGAEHQLSSICAANAALHEQILAVVDAGIERLAHRAHHSAPSSS